MKPELKPQPIHSVGRSLRRSVGSKVIQPLRKDQLQFSRLQPHSVVMSMVAEVLRKYRLSEGVDIPASLKHVKTKSKCVWKMGDRCKGEVRSVELFSSQIRVSVCERHLRHHVELMVIHAFKGEINGVLNTSVYTRSLLAQHCLAIDSLSSKKVKL